MKIITLQTGIFQTNTYIIVNGENSIIVDPAGDVDKIKQTLIKERISLKYVLLTHCHFDHCNGVLALQQNFSLTVFSSEKEQELVNTNKNLAYTHNITFNKFKVDRFVQDGETLNLDGVAFKVVFTPGHTVGGVCYICEDVIFCGDTIFFLSIGRTDLPTGNGNVLINSIKEKLYTLSSDYKLLPGHGEETSLFFEKENNPYV